MNPKRIFIRTLGIGVGISLVLIGGVWYVKADIDARSAAIIQSRANIQNREDSLDALTALQRESEKAKGYAAQIDALLTSKEQLLGFSSDIGLLVQQAGFSGSPKFKEETAPTAGDLQKTNFSLTLEGQKKLSDLGAFLASVEKSNYFVRFTRIDTSRDDAILRVALEGYVIAF